jgi:hypothetical protein
MIKGKTVIELKDVNTGAVEIFTDENMVTNALADFFSHNIEGGLFNMGGSTGDFNGNMIPLCMNAIGGILLFADPLTEDKKSYYAPSANPCTGYASNDVNSTANVMRGSLNLTESTRLDKGYKFVWDFATSQANGTISAVALTHKWGGIGYMGDTYDNTNKRWHMKDQSWTADAIVRTAYINCVEINFEENYFITIGLNTSNEVVIQKIRKPYRVVGLNDTLTDSSIVVLEETKITPTIFIMTNPSNNNGNYDFIDGKDGYWYGIWHDANGSGNASVKWIKIKKSDCSFSEGTWTLDNCQLQSAGYRSGYNTGPSRNTQSVILNGYLYMVSYDRTAVYKINLGNVADVTKIKLGFTTNYSSAAPYYNSGNLYLTAIGDWIVGSDFRIASDDTVYKCSNTMPFSYACTPLFQYGPFLLGYGGYYGQNTKRELFMLSPYLATINNLSTSVIKTADKTMKITYTITETE